MRRSVHYNYVSELIVDTVHSYKPRGTLRNCNYHTLIEKLSQLLSLQALPRLSGWMPAKRSQMTRAV